MNQEHEHTLNVWLAAHLRSHGLDARPEAKQAGNRRLDVEVRIGSLVIAVEAERGQGRAKQAAAIRDADARLKQGLAQCALAVCYPDNTTEASLPTAQLLWTVRDAAAPAEAAWSAGSLEQLVSVIRLAPAQLGDPDAVAADLSQRLDGAVARLSETQKRTLAQALDLPASGARARRKAWDAAAKRALLVIVTAVMFHARLDGHRDRLRPTVDNRVAPPQPFEDDWPPALAQACAEDDDPVRAFAAAWNLILALDYKPIFETGRAALLSCPQDPAYTAAIRDSARAALSVAGAIAGLRHDLLGRIFHTVLDSARYDGSFYTTTAAATLLATLAIDESMRDWRDAAAIARLRIVDPACGTGTLLMAAAERIRSLAPQSWEDEKVAAALIEHVLSGYDVNLTATHMAATTLGLLSPTTQFRNMKIGRALLGVDEFGEAYLGSLEFLDRQPYLIPWPKSAPAVSQIESGEEIAQAEEADLVIMNPPFTRDSLRHDQFTRAEERKIKAREKALFANKPVHLSSNGNAFLILADFISKPETGAIAAILPLVTATNASSLETRKYLASQYHIEMIVTSHDPDRIYFSENTSIGEMLLICRRWGADRGAKPPTRVVNLAVNPASPSAALSTAYAIKDGTVAAQGVGTAQEWPQEKIAAGDWGAAQFLSPFLCLKFAALKNSALFPSIALGRISEIGPAGQGIRGVFLRSDMPDERGRVALWNHDTTRIQSMAATWDTHISAKPGKAHLADSYWQQRGNMLLPTRLFLQTTRATTVRVSVPCVGSAWVPCHISQPQALKADYEKALGVYLNSSVGILALLGDRSNKKPTYPNISIDDMRKLFVPDFAALGEDAAPLLAATYDAHAGDVMRPLPQMDACPVRRALDDAVITALGLDGEMVATVRRSLAAEPSVTGRRYEVQ